MAVCGDGVMLDILYWIMIQEYNYLFKIVVIGDAGVGKTNLVSVFVDGVFMEDQKPTVGVEFSSKSFHINGKDIRCQIWDTAGQERFRAVTKAYYNGAVGAIVVFDLTNTKSFESVSKWIDEASENTRKDTVILLVGNKSDLATSREVKMSRIEDLINTHKNRVVYIQTSALNGSNVQEAFKVLVESICEQKKLQMDNIKKGLQRSQLGKESDAKQQPNIKLKNANFDEYQGDKSKTTNGGKAKRQKKGCC